MQQVEIDPSSIQEVACLNVKMFLQCCCSCSQEGTVGMAAKYFTKPLDTNYPMSKMVTLN